MLLKGVMLTFSDLFEKKYRPDEVIAGRYEVRKMLGKGSYGCSYLVYDRTQNQESVLKMLRFHKRITRSGESLINKEVEMLNAVSHPCFPKVLDKGVYDNKHFFTMEYVNGKTFEQLIFQEGKIYSEVEAFSLGLELLSLIMHIHSKGMIHRDVRIPNIMMDGNQMKLIDFGLARFLNERKNKDPYHLPKAISPVSDFYGLGHFLLFLLYSGYSPSENQKEKSWDEELDISPKSKQMIKKLLLIEAPYESAKAIYQEIEEIIFDSRRNSNVIV